jgi:muramoyltetrapeptide carboxypeptidase
VNSLFANQSVKAIICAKGGYGSMRILDYLDFDSIKNNSKSVIGFSDNTALLTALINRTGQSVTHEPNTVSLVGADNATTASLFSALASPAENIAVPDSYVIKEDCCTGILSGGNIATITHLIGTEYQPKFKKMILFLEDIGEPAYKIDRMLTQMKMTGLFNGIKGVVTGSFEKCDPQEMIFEIITEVFEDMNIPILSGINSGHEETNLSLLMGVKAEMDTSKLIST